MSTTKPAPLLQDFEAIIFDMDGVLIDSEPLWKIAMETVFGQYGSTLTHQDFQKTVGLRIDEVIAFWNAHERWGLQNLQMVEDQIINQLISLIEQHPQPLQSRAPLDRQPSQSLLVFPQIGDRGVRLILE